MVTAMGTDLVTAARQALETTTTGMHTMLR